MAVTARQVQALPGLMYVDKKLGGVGAVQFMRHLAQVVRNGLGIGRRRLLRAQRAGDGEAAAGQCAGTIRTRFHTEPPPKQEGRLGRPS